MIILINRALASIALRKKKILVINCASSARYWISKIIKSNVLLLKLNPISFAVN